MGPTQTAELTWPNSHISGTPRPQWNWNNGLPVPTTLHVEPSSLPRMGLVCLELAQNDRKFRIWLSGDLVASLQAGLGDIADYAASQHDE
jgi:hypothetical protein